MRCQTQDKYRATLQHKYFLNPKKLIISPKTNQNTEGKIQDHDELILDFTNLVQQ